MAEHENTAPTQEATVDWSRLSDADLIAYTEGNFGAMTDRHKNSDGPRATVLDREDHGHRWDSRGRRCQCRSGHLRLDKGRESKLSESAYHGPRH